MSVGSLATSQGSVKILALLAHIAPSHVEKLESRAIIFVSILVMHRTVSTDRYC